MNSKRKNSRRISSLVQVGLLPIDIFGNLPQITFRQSLRLQKVVGAFEENVRNQDLTSTTVARRIAEKLIQQVRKKTNQTRVKT